MNSLGRGEEGEAANQEWLVIGGEAKMGGGAPAPTQQVAQALQEPVLCLAPAKLPFDFVVVTETKLAPPSPSRWLDCEVVIPFGKCWEAIRPHEVRATAVYPCKGSVASNSQSSSALSARFIS